MLKIKKNTIKENTLLLLKEDIKFKEILKIKNKRDHILKVIF